MDTLFGLVAAQVANSVPGRKGRPVQPRDFFTSAPRRPAKDVLKRFAKRPLMRGG